MHETVPGISAGGVKLTPVKRGSVERDLTRHLTSLLTGQMRSDIKRWAAAGGGGWRWRGWKVNIDINAAYLYSDDWGVIYYNFYV